MFWRGMAEELELSCELYCLPFLFRELPVVSAQTPFHAGTTCVPTPYHTGLKGANCSLRRYGRSKTPPPTPPFLSLFSSQAASRPGGTLAPKRMRCSTPRAGGTAHARDEVAMSGRKRSGGGRGGGGGGRRQFSRELGRRRGGEFELRERWLCGAAAGPR